MKQIQIHNISEYETEIKNGILVLILKIPHIKYYQQETENNILTLNSEINYINEKELSLTSFTNSEILECMILDEDGNTISENKKFIKILIDIYNNVPSSNIIQNTTMNIDIGQKLNGTKGYNYYDTLGLSIQNKDSNGTFKEICNMITINNYSLDIIIQLGNCDKIGYKLFPKKPI
jgi:hypothetical protein